LKEIVAPSASNLALIPSASSNLTFSLMSVGAFSTKSLASLSPSPRSSLTTLITQIFCCPISVNSILTVSAFPAAASPPAAQPAAHATTIAAALTPNSSSNPFTNWFSSTALISFTISIIFCAFFDNSAIRMK